MSGMAFLLLPFILHLASGESPVARQPEPARLGGQFLVATTRLDDPPFAQSVIYMIEHNSQGAMGLIINRPMRKVAFSKLLPKEDRQKLDLAGEVQVYFGGPVELNQGFLLHSTDVMLEGSRQIGDGVAISAGPAMLRAIAAGRGPKQYIFALGYAGWRASQLEGEIAEGSWITAKAEASIVFAAEPSQTWQRLVDQRILRM
ncbi:MAG: YqgE/AlgH family protein [Acidobacteria bacterium]|nr:YqgE/AlgH family protein [Acidobacteriota bacterium]